MDINLLNKLIYRSWHRGCKETDILLGDFAKNEIFNLSESEIEIYEKFIEEKDDLIYKWLLSEDCQIEEYKAIIDKIKQFNNIKNKIC